MSRRGMYLPEWEEYGGWGYATIDDRCHTDLWEPEEALRVVEQLMRELDSVGGQFPPGLRAISHFAWGGF